MRPSARSCSMTSYGLSDIVLHLGWTHVTSHNNVVLGERYKNAHNFIKKNQICLEQCYMGSQCHHHPAQTYICSAVSIPLNAWLKDSVTQSIGRKCWYTMRSISLGWMKMRMARRTLFPWWSIIIGCHADRRRPSWISTFHDPIHNPWDLHYSQVETFILLFYIDLSSCY